MIGSEVVGRKGAAAAAAAAAAASTATATAEDIRDQWAC